MSRAPSPASILATLAKSNVPARMVMSDGKWTIETLTAANSQEPMPDDPLTAWEKKRGIDRP